MNNRFLYRTLFFGTLFFSLFSCEKNLKEIQNYSKVTLTPSSEAENFVMKHTDSARIKSVLKSPLVYDYTGVELPFTEFPEGVNITMYDVNANESYIESDYAITYKSSIIDLQKNVKVTSNNGYVLTTSQLYYDQSREWIFTEQDCTLSNSEGTWYFKGFDSKSDLTELELRNFKGMGNFSEE